MDCVTGAAFDTAEDEGSEAGAELTPVAEAGNIETELEFLTRRAMEESRLAKRASTPRAAAAHSYLAAAYSAAIAKELARQAELESLLLKIQ